MPGTCTAENFHALPENGPTDSYTVVGTVVCPTTGWGVELVPDNEGIVNDPTLAILTVKLTAPKGVSLDRVTPYPVECPDVSDSELAQILIRLPDGVSTSAGDQQITLPVPPD